MSANRRRNILIYHWQESFWPVQIDATDILFLRKRSFGHISKWYKLDIALNQNEEPFQAQAIQSLMHRSISLISHGRGLYLWVLILRLLCVNKNATTTTLLLCCNHAGCVLIVKVTRQHGKIAHIRNQCLSKLQCTLITCIHELHCQNNYIVVRITASQLMNQIIDSLKHVRKPFAPATLGFVHLQLIYLVWNLLTQR